MRYWLQIKATPERGWSSRLVWRYTLLQLPAIALLIIILVLVNQWFDLPAWLSWGLIIFWIVKDIVLFPFVWRAYDWEGKTAIHSMIGRRGLAKEGLSSSGYVQIGNEAWQAKRIADSPLIKEGDAIRVRDIQGLTLLVERYSPEE